MDTPPPSSESRKLDHRVEVAKKKRIAMNERLLQATMSVFSRSAPGAATIEDVIREAGISRGTFYKHFESLDDALAAVGMRLSEQLSAGIGPIYHSLDSPIRRACVGTRMLLLRASVDRVWAEFVQHANAEPHESDIYRLIEEDLKRGRLQKQFEFENLSAATDLVMGVNLMAFRGIAKVSQDERDAYIDTVIDFMMRALGAAKRARTQASAFSRNYVRKMTKERPWWLIDEACEKAPAN